MSVRTAIRKYLHSRAARWERRRTERYISSLPLEIQKDIGWRLGQSPDQPGPAHPRDSLFERRW